MGSTCMDTSTVSACTALPLHGRTGKKCTAPVLARAASGLWPSGSSQCCLLREGQLMHCKGSCHCSCSACRTEIKGPGPAQIFSPSIIAFSAAENCEFEMVAKFHTHTHTLTHSPVVDWLQHLKRSPLLALLLCLMLHACWIRAPSMITDWRRI